MSKKDENVHTKIMSNYIFDRLVLILAVLRVRIFFLAGNPYLNQVVFCRGLG